MRLTIAIMLLATTQSSALAESAAPFVIKGTLMTIHDRLPPYQVKDIVVKSDFTFTVSGDKRVEETWAINPIRNRDNPSLHFPPLGGESHATLGGDGPGAGALSAADFTTWHVRGPHTLERISAGRQRALRMTIEIDDKKNCKVTAKFYMQKGKSFEIDKRSDNGQFAAFSLNKVTSATCSVE
jgi:hypothetical protein